MKKTIQMLKEQIKEIDSSFEVLSKKYSGHYKKIKFYHHICGNTVETTPNSFISHGGVCPFCNGGVRGNLNDFKKLLRGTSLSTIEESIYVNVDTPIKLYCNKCKDIVSIRPKQFKITGKCKGCSGLQRHTTQKFKERVKSLTDLEYTVLGEYVNNSTCITMKHNVCNHIYEVRPKDFTKKNGNRCPFCKRSQGEIIINNYLKKYEFDYEWGYRDNECINELPLEFDFKIKLSENKYIYIEYDGRLHYEPWKTDDKKHYKHLLRQINNDRIKNEYCRDNNIPLLRIPYWEFNNIDKILDEVLFSCSSTTNNVVHKLMNETRSILEQDNIYENILNEMKI